MEADWEFDIGADAPAIDAYWSGLIDLRAHPERICGLAECRELPGLADVLIRLNATDSPVWTSKTDVFTPERIDPDEMEASREDAGYAIACYVDILMRSDKIWNSPARVKHDCEALCQSLRAKPLACCRVDLVVRRAAVAETNDLGATIYFSACGPSLERAKNRLGECLAAFAEEIVPRG